MLKTIRNTISLSITIYTPKYYVTKKEPAMFCSANFPRLPRKFHWLILSNFRLSRQEERINKNKQNKTQQKVDIYIFVFVSLRPKLKEKCRDLFLLKIPCLLHVPDAVFIREQHLFWNCTYQGWQQGLIIWRLLCQTCRYFFSCWDVTHSHFPGL